MARRPGGAARRPQRQASPPDDAAPGWARFLRRLNEAEERDSAGDVLGVWARFLRRIASARDGTDDSTSSNA